MSFWIIIVILLLKTPMRHINNSTCSGNRALFLDISQRVWGHFTRQRDGSIPPQSSRFCADEGGNRGPPSVSGLAQVRDLPLLIGYCRVYGINPGFIRYKSQFTIVNLFIFRHTAQSIEMAMRRIGETPKECRVNTAVDMHLMRYALVSTFDYFWP